VRERFELDNVVSVAIQVDLGTERSSRVPGIVTHEERVMAESVYKVIQLVGTSTESWEKATAAAIDQASQSLRDLRIAEVDQLDVTIDNGGVQTYRARVNVSFKYEGGD
jgi:flavin-binding protein dodecin